MNTLPDGGPAFPVSTSDPKEGHQDGHSTWMFPGISKRDYFAAKAMQTILIGSHQQEHRDMIEALCFKNHITASQQVAMMSYQMADAMVAEGSKQP